MTPESTTIVIPGNIQKKLTELEVKLNMPFGIKAAISPSKGEASTEVAY
jgi:hypothetical protein